MSQPPNPATPSLSRLQVVMIITGLTVAANLLSDLALLWPSSFQGWVQFIAARVSSGILMFITLWAGTDPFVSEVLVKKDVKNNRSVEPEGAPTKTQALASYKASFTGYLRSIATVTCKVAKIC